LEPLPGVTIYALSVLPDDLVQTLAATLQASWAVECETTAVPITLEGTQRDSATLALDLGIFAAPSAEPRDLGETARQARIVASRLCTTCAAAPTALWPCYEAATRLTPAPIPDQGTIWPLAMTLALLLPGPRSAEQQVLFPAGLRMDELRDALQDFAAFPDFPRLPPPGFDTVWPSAASASNLQPARFTYDVRRDHWKLIRD